MTRKPPMARRLFVASASLLFAQLGCGDDTTGSSAGGGGSTGSTAAATGADTGSSSGKGSTSGSSGDGGAGEGGDGSPQGTGAGPGSGGDGSGGSTFSSPGCGAAPTAGTTNETIQVGGVDRTFVLAIPEGVDGVTGVPLIFGFHGFDGTGESASQYFGLTGAEPAIYVYPQALPLPDEDGGVGWDMTPDGVDVAFFDAMVQHFADTQCIDLDRVFSAGHSHGASFSNHLGCYRSDVLRAIAPVAGGGPWAGECTGSVSAMLTHGSADEDVPIENGIASRDHWLEVNGCAGASSAPVDPAPCVAYDGCNEPVLWCEHDGAHIWPEGTGANIRQFFFAF